jgi:hypothetical protein
MDFAFQQGVSVKLYLRSLSLLQKFTSSSKPSGDYLMTEHRCDKIIEEERYLNKYQNISIRMSLQLINGAWHILCRKLSKEIYERCPYCGEKLHPLNQVEIT